MMHWFQTISPIRQKLFVAFGTMTGITAAATAVAVVAPPLVGGLFGLAAILTSAALGFRFRHAIAYPYVSTVVRMEGLAAGDLSSPIEFVEYRDCVGRLTKAMFTFRDNAIAQQRDAEQQAEVVRVLGAHLAALAQGNLSEEITAEFPESYALLRSNFNEALTNLRAMIGSVSDSAETIRTGSEEIARASEDLSRRTEQQAASLEETAAAMTQITATVKDSAAGASQADRLVQATRADAEASSDVVRSAVKAMGEIEKSSQEITKIIEVIDKIAFQTNLLALNASVEAAHAGEAGRAFAVVANEVRALAQRSADAAQEIGQLISTSTAQVDSGVQLVGEAGKALERIIGSVGDVSGLVSSIAAAADQQAVALSEVNIAIAEMDKVTQQNAAMVEETSAAARNLTGEVVSLNEQASQFRTESTAEPRSRQQRVSPRGGLHAAGNLALVAGA